MEVFTDKAQHLIIAVTTWFLGDSSYVSQADTVIFK